MTLEVEYIKKIPYMGIKNNENVDNAVKEAIDMPKMTTTRLL